MTKFNLENNNVEQNSNNNIEPYAFTPGEQNKTSNKYILRVFFISFSFQIADFNKEILS